MPILTSSYVDALVERGMKYTFKLTAPGSKIWNFAMDGLFDMMKAERGSPPKSCGIYMGSDAVSMSVAKSLPIEAKKIGLDVVSQVNFQGNLTDPSVVISPILQKKPEIIFLSSFLTDAILILKTMRGLGIKTPVAAAGGISADSAGKALGAAADRVFMPWSWNWDLKVPGESELVEAYKKAHADAPYPPNNEQLGLGYAGGMIAAQALEKAASREGPKLREVLASTEFTGLPLPSRTSRSTRPGSTRRGADPRRVERWQRAIRCGRRSCRRSSRCVRGQPRPGAMNSQGWASLVMSVITSISAGLLAARASRSAERRPSASVTRQEGTPKLWHKSGSPGCAARSRNRGPRTCGAGRAARCRRRSC